MPKPTRTNTPKIFLVNAGAPSGREARWRPAGGMKPKSEKDQVLRTCGFLVRIRAISLRLYTAAAIAAGHHLFPFRTEKLSPPSPMVLTYQSEEEAAAVLRVPDRSHDLPGTFFLCPYRQEYSAAVPLTLWQPLQ